MNKKQSLDRYYRDIGKIQLISPDEEIKLSRRIRQNDQVALKKLVSSNLRFVVNVAKSYQNRGLSLEDLINEGNLGLVNAAHRFDETRGFKFISYAVWWIRQAILEAIAVKPRMIRLPINRIATLTKIRKVYSKLEQEFERSPTNEEIASMLDIDSDDISKTIKRASRVTSFDSPMFGDRADTIILLFFTRSTLTAWDSSDVNNETRRIVASNLSRSIVAHTVSSSGTTCS